LKKSNAPKGRARRPSGAEILDLGVGEPDEMAAPEAVAKLEQEARRPENRGYADNGDHVLKDAAARYLEKVCGVSGINPEAQIMHSIGARPLFPFCPPPSSIPAMSS